MYTQAHEANGKSHEENTISFGEIFAFLERRLLGEAREDERENDIAGKFSDAFKNSNYPFSMHVDHLRKRLAGGREVPPKQTQNTHDNVHNQEVFAMNEELVIEQAMKEELLHEVASLRKKVQRLEDEVRTQSLLRRSLQINLQAALDHLHISTRLLSDESEKGANNTLGTPKKSNNAPRTQPSYEDLEPTDQVLDLNQIVDVEFTDDGVDEGEGTQEGRAEQAWGEVRGEEREDGEGRGEEKEGEGEGADPEEPGESQAGAPRGTGDGAEPIDDDSGFEFFV